MSKAQQMDDPYSVFDCEQVNDFLVRDIIDYDADADKFTVAKGLNPEGKKHALDLLREVFGCDYMTDDEEAEVEQKPKPKYGLKRGAQTKLKEPNITKKTQLGRKSNPQYHNKQFSQPKQSYQNTGDRMWVFDTLKDDLVMQEIGREFPDNDQPKQIKIWGDRVGKKVDFYIERRLIKIQRESSQDGNFKYHYLQPTTGKKKYVAPQPLNYAYNRMMTELMGGDISGYHYDD